MCFWLRNILLMITSLIANFLIALNTLMPLKIPFPNVTYKELSRLPHRLAVLSHRDAMGHGPDEALGAVVENDRRGRDLAFVQINDIWSSSMVYAVFQISQ